MPADPPEGAARRGFASGASPREPGAERCVAPLDEQELAYAEAHVGSDFGELMVPRLVATIREARADAERARAERDEAVGLLDYFVDDGGGAHEPGALQTSCRSCNKRWPCPTRRARDLAERFGAQIAAKVDLVAHETSDPSGETAAGTAVRTSPVGAGSTSPAEHGLAAVVRALAAHREWITFLLTPTLCDEGETHTNYLGELYEGRAGAVLDAARAREAAAGSGGS